MKDIKPADADVVTGAAKLLPPLDTTYLHETVVPALPIRSPSDVEDYTSPDDLPK